MSNSKNQNEMSAKMSELLTKKEVPIDIHCHAFTFRHVPDKFFEFRIPLNKKTVDKIEYCLHRIFSKTDTDKLSKFAYFMGVAKSPAMSDIADKLFSYYDNHYLFGDETIICPLLMDLQPNEKAGVKGTIETHYREQIEEIHDLRMEYSTRILPFIAIDPRRKNVINDVFELAINSIEFFGIKLYPSLGYLPSHPILMEIYKKCVDYDIPITVHCSTAFVRTRYHKLEVPGIHYDLKDPSKPPKSETRKEWFFSERKYAHYFNNPDRWRPVLEKFPDLRLNFAHFGGSREWKKYVKKKDNSWPSKIIDLIYRYSNVYTDVSMIISERDLHEPLRKLLERNPRLSEKVLYGSDYYMTVTEGHFRTILTDFCMAMGETLLNKMSIGNVRNFLNINILK